MHANDQTQSTEGVYKRFMIQGLTIVLVSNAIFAAMFLPFILGQAFWRKSCGWGLFDSLLGELIMPSVILGIGQLVWIPVSLLVYVVLRQEQLLAGMFLAAVISFAIFFLLLWIGMSQFRVGGF